MRQLITIYTAVCLFVCAGCQQPPKHDITHQHTDNHSTVTKQPESEWDVMAKKVLLYGGSAIVVITLCQTLYRIFDHYYTKPKADEAKRKRQEKKDSAMEGLCRMFADVKNANDDIKLLLMGKYSEQGDEFHQAPLRTISKRLSKQTKATTSIDSKMTTIQSKVANIDTTAGASHIHLGSIKTGVEGTNTLLKKPLVLKQPINEFSLKSSRAFSSSDDELFKEIPRKKTTGKKLELKAEVIKTLDKIDTPSDTSVPDSIPTDKPAEIKDTPDIVEVFS